MKERKRKKTCNPINLIKDDIKLSAVETNVRKCVNLISTRRNGMNGTQEKERTTHGVRMKKQM
jgi:hypothetical protein